VRLPLCITLTITFLGMMAATFLPWRAAPYLVGLLGISILWFFYAAYRRRIIYGRSYLTGRSHRRLDAARGKVLPFPQNKVR